MSAATPSASLLAQLRAELVRAPPFAQMAVEHVDRFIAASQQVYHAPGEAVLTPQQGPVVHLRYVRRGRIARRSPPDDADVLAPYEPGDLFPVGALMAARAVTATYVALDDVFCLNVPAAEVHALAAVSAPFAAFLQQRMLAFLDHSRQALQARQAQQALAEQSSETTLGALARRPAVGVPPGTAIGDALSTLHERGIGSLLVLDAAGAAAGILTRHDILERVVLARPSMDAPIESIASAPVLTLAADASAQDAAILMSRHGVRHVPVTQSGRVVGMVSERDLFALQRLSLQHLGGALRGAPDLPSLQRLAGEIRRLARNLLAQGVRARQLTELVSHLNDVLLQRLVTLVAAQHRVDLRRACWLAFGSEGRGEQTVVTDQDNGLVFDSDDANRDRRAWLAFARDVNEGLATCGYPLCKGNVMASNPDCCMTPHEWSNRFAAWMEHGSPHDLLNASIFFDLRPVAGRHALAEPLRALLTSTAAALPRFISQLALNALERRAPIGWLGGIDTQHRDGHEWVDLKLQGTAIFVDAARVYALANGVAATGTRQRIEAIAPAISLAARESEAWIAAFEFLQQLRLQAQLDGAAVATAEQPNRIDVAALNDLDRRMLRESLRTARRLQQRIALDYRR